jgi:hypothetical protein
MTKRDDERRVMDKARRICDGWNLVRCNDGRYWIASPPPNPPTGTAHIYIKGTLAEIEALLDDEKKRRRALTKKVRR